MFLPRSAGLLLLATVLGTASASVCGGVEIARATTSLSGLSTCFNNAGTGVYASEFTQMASTGGDHTPRLLEIFRELITTNERSLQMSCGCASKGARELPACGAFQAPKDQMDAMMPGCNFLASCPSLDLLAFIDAASTCVSAGVRGSEWRRVCSRGNECDKALRGLTASGEFGQAFSCALRLGAADKRFVLSTVGYSAEDQATLDVDKTLRAGATRGWPAIRAWACGVDEAAGDEPEPESHKKTEFWTYEDNNTRGISPPSPPLPEWPPLWMLRTWAGKGARKESVRDALVDAAARRVRELGEEAALPAEAACLNLTTQLFSAFPPDDGGDDGSGGGDGVCGEARAWEGACRDELGGDAMPADLASLRLQPVGALQAFADEWRAQWLLGGNTVPQAAWMLGAAAGGARGGTRAACNDVVDSFLLLLLRWWRGEGGRVAVDARRGRGEAAGEAAVCVRPMRDGSGVVIGGPEVVADAFEFSSRETSPLLPRAALFRPVLCSRGVWHAEERRCGPPVAAQQPREGVSVVAPAAAVLIVGASILLLLLLWRRSSRGVDVDETAFVGSVRPSPELTPRRAEKRSLLSLDSGAGSGDVQ